MPKEYSHLYLGKKLLGELVNLQDEAIVSNQKIDTSSFLLGNTAPDLFFYDFPVFRLRTLAKLLHHGRGEALFKIIVSLVEKSKKGSYSSALYSFSLGCLCHLAADITWHPLVLKCCSVCPEFPKAPMCPRQSACHFRIESYLDILLARFFNIKMKKKDFPTWIGLFHRNTRILLDAYCSELNRIRSTHIICSTGSSYRCLITQVVFLTCFQVKPLFWSSLIADMLSIKRFDQYQALFYPPDYFVNRKFFTCMTPGIKLLLNMDGNLLEEYVSSTMKLAKSFMIEAHKLKSGTLDKSRAYLELLKLSPSSGVDGYL